MAKSPERLPIYDEEAEGMVIGCVVLDPTCLAEIDLDPEDFFVENYRHLWEAILALRDRGAEVNQATVNHEASKVEPWVLQKVTAEALPAECLHYADIVKEMSRQRRLVGSVETAMKEYRRKQLSSQELADQLQLCLNMLDFPTNSSRTITVSNPRIVEGYPPIYELTVSSTNGKVTADIKITSDELDKPVVFRRKVRELLKINPLLPKQFDAFVHQVLQQARTEQGAGDAADESICYWIKDWFTGASEAESQDDLAQGYLDRDGAYWFSVDRLISYISERSKNKLDRSSFWSVIHGCGGRQSKTWRIGGKRARLWGLDHAFFQEDELSEGEQIPLQVERKPQSPEEDDLKWLEDG